MHFSLAKIRSTVRTHVMYNNAVRTTFLYLQYYCPILNKDCSWPVIHIIVSNHIQNYNKADGTWFVRTYPGCSVTDSWTNSRLTTPTHGAFNDIVAPPAVSWYLQSTFPFLIVSPALTNQLVSQVGSRTGSFTSRVGNSCCIQVSMLKLLQKQIRILIF